MRPLRPSPRGGECGLVLSGRLEVTVGFDQYELGPGDSIAFDSNVPHCLRNVGDEPVYGVWFVIGRHGDHRAAPSTTSRRRSTSRSSRDAAQLTIRERCGRRDHDAAPVRLDGGGHGRQVGGRGGRARRARAGARRDRHRQGDDGVRGGERRGRSCSVLVAEGGRRRRSARRSRWLGEPGETPPERPTRTPRRLPSRRSAAGAGGTPEPARNSPSPARLAVARAPTRLLIARRLAPRARRRSSTARDQGTGARAG